jgi:hypothetical protein
MHADEQPIWPHSVFADCYFEPSYVTNVHRLENGILPVNSSAIFAPSKATQAMPMNYSYNQKNSDGLALLEQSYAPFATRPEVVSHVFLHQMHMLLSHNPNFFLHLLDLCLSHM